MPSEKLLSLQDAVNAIKRISIPRRIDMVIVHHTWRPTSKDYRGIATVRAVRNYHMYVRGWRDNGYHIMIGPDGSVFFCRPMEEVGAHCKGKNRHSIGLSYIADFDAEDPTQYGGMETGQAVVAALLERFGLSVEDVHFHREYANKSCPGKRMNLTWYRQRVSRLMKGTDRQLRIVLAPDDKLIECRPAIEEGVTRVDLRPLAEALGYDIDLTRLKSHKILRLVKRVE